MTDQLMDDLTNEEHEALLLMSEHAIAPPLSAAADAVLDAYMANCGWLDGPLEKDYRCVAAVLRAAAEELQYRLFLPGTDPMVVDAKALFNLANELEGGND